MSIYRDTEARHHYRRIYSLLELLGDVGGLYEGIMIFLFMLLRPIAHHSFIVQAMSRLYKAKTETEGLLPDLPGIKVQKIME